MEIYDQDGTLKDWEWLRQRFGAVEVAQAGQWEVVRLDEMEGPAAVVVTVMGADAPLPGVMVEWGWPDGVYREATKEDGTVGFAMGDGAFYDPTKTKGPHYVKTVEPGDLVSGLGMVGKTNHRHLDIIYALRSTAPAPAPKKKLAKVVQTFLEGVKAATQQALADLEME